MQQPSVVYIITNKPNGILYIGVTSDLKKRMAEHQQETYESFSKKHGLKNLVYFELFDDITLAIQREKNMKKWKRAWKVALILNSNPYWIDMTHEL